mmetsp:Transcript_45002/g.93726  ORF Transcript_45002/g.93726 Transcript_45002/m.93726 type:complete len:246 (+) Transcript_45002:239-976(+)
MERQRRRLRSGDAGRQEGGPPQQQQEQRVLRAADLLRLERGRSEHHRDLLHRHDLHHLGRPHPAGPNAADRPRPGGLRPGFCPGEGRLCLGGGRRLRTDVRPAEPRQFDDYLRVAGPRTPAPVGVEQTGPQLHGNLHGRFEAHGDPGHPRPVPSGGRARGAHWVRQRHGVGPPFVVPHLYGGRRFPGPDLGPQRDAETTRRRPYPSLQRGGRNQQPAVEREPAGLGVDCLQGQATDLEGVKNLSI